MRSRGFAAKPLSTSISVSLLDLIFPFGRMGEELPKAVPDVRWIPGVLSTARTQENGESTFQPAGLFHPSTIYMTGKHRMSKSFHKFNEKLTCGVCWPFDQTGEELKSTSMEISFINSSRSRHLGNQKENLSIPETFCSSTIYIAKSPIL